MIRNLKKALQENNSAVDLFEALARKDILSAKRLIKNTDVNVRNRLGETPLIISARNGWEEFTQELIEAHADMDAQDNEGKTALMHCFLNNQLKTAHLLVDAGANVSLSDKAGHTAALYAIQEGITTLMSFPEEDRISILKHSFEAYLNTESNREDTTVQFIYEYLLKTMNKLSPNEQMQFLKNTSLKTTPIKLPNEKVMRKSGVLEERNLKTRKTFSEKLQNEASVENAFSSDTTNRSVDSSSETSRRQKKTRGQKISKIKLISVLLGAILFSTSAWAGLSEALTAYGIKRYEQAFAEFSYLADEGDATAAYYLGKMYANGEGVEKNDQKAIEYYQKAESAYNIDAAYELAEILLNDSADSEDEKFENGLKYLKRAAYAGQPNALFQLGEFYEKGNGVPQDYKNAFGFYLMGALKGDMKSQYRVSRLYLAGRGVPQDFENGLKWLSRSARQGYVVAQKDLADARASMPALKNLPDAYAWYSIIAAFNSDEVGEEARKKRNEIEKKIKKKDVVLARQRAAREWRPISAEKSVPASDLLLIPTPIIPGFNDAESVQAMLAQGEVLLTDGRKYGVQPDMIVKASIDKDFKPIEKAINSAVGKGDTQAYAYYGDLLRSRFQNDKDAVDWYRKGAESGDAYAQYQLAKAYCEGRGVDAARPSQCYAWLKIAEKNSADTLKLTISNALEVVDTDLTPEERTQGEQLITEYEGQAKKSDPTNDLMNLLN